MKEDTQAIFYYAIYQNLALGLVAEAERTLSDGREITRKEIKLKFDPKNVTLGMDIGECDQPILYAVRAGNKSIKVLDCNLNFCWTMMVTKSQIKNKDLMSLVPSNLQTSYKNLLRILLKHNSPKYGEFLFNYKGESIRKYSFSVKVSFRNIP